MTKLTDVERAERDMLEDELAAFLFDPLTGLAPTLGWETLHVRPGVRAGGRWWTATTGSLHAWPDWTLVRTRDRRIVFAELKRQREEPTAQQAAVLEVLRQLASTWPLPAIIPPTIADWELCRVDVVVWRPSDIREPLDQSNAYRVLR